VHFGEQPATTTSVDNHKQQPQRGRSRRVGEATPSQYYGFKTVLKPTWGGKVEPFHRDESVRMLAAERRSERAADQVVRYINCEISQQPLTGEIQ